MTAGRVAFVLGVWAAGAPVIAPHAQSAAPARKLAAKAAKPAIARMADGRPDLSGTWNFATITPLERPKELGDKQVLTEAEANALERKFAEELVEPPPAVVGDPDPFGAGRGYNQAFRDPGARVVASRRTSIVVDPADGRIPPLTPEAQKRRAARLAAASHPAGPEDFNNATRCLIGFNTGPPMIPGVYNNFVQLVQTTGYVAIATEMGSGVRIVPLDARPSVQIPQWFGVSSGRWEGDTLVIDTRNFSAKAAFRDAADENLRVVERFTRVDHETLFYEFTVDDSTAWTRPWSGQVSMAKTSDKIYEYACHEANYALANVLSAERLEDKKK